MSLRAARRKLKKHGASDTENEPLSQLQFVEQSEVLVKVRSNDERTKSMLQRGIWFRPEKIPMPVHGSHRRLNNSFAHAIIYHRGIFCVDGKVEILNFRELVKHARYPDQQI